MRVILIIPILLFNILQAQNISKVQSVLWKVESSKSGRTSYVLGTFHSFGREWVEKFPVIKERIQASNVFFCEMKNTAETNNFKYFDSTTKAKRFDDFFGIESNKVDSFFTGYIGINQPFSAIINKCEDYGSQQMEILVYSKLLALQYRDEILNKEFNPTDESYFLPLDYLLETLADSSKIKINALDNSKFIKENVYDENFFEGHRELLQLINSIIDLKRGAVNRIVDNDKKEYCLYNKGLFDFSVAYDQKKSEIDWTTNVKRNKTWVKKMHDVLKQNHCFVAVGVGHLFSNNKYGVLDMLRKKGFKISEVRLQ